MAILDQLMEKKDLVIYIDERTKQLNNMDLSKICSKHRASAKKKAEGKICELKKIKHLISQGTLKKTAINLWEQNRKKPKWDVVEAGNFAGIDVVVSDLSFDIGHEERKKCAEKILKDLNKVSPGFNSLADHPEDKRILLSEEDKRIIREGTFMEATVELLGKSVNQDWLKEASDYLKTLRYAGKRMNS